MAVGAMATITRNVTFMAGCITGSLLGMLVQMVGIYHQPKNGKSYSVLSAVVLLVVFLRRKEQNIGIIQTQVQQIKVVLELCRAGIRVQIILFRILGKRQIFGHPQNMLFLRKGYMPYHTD